MEWEPQLPVGDFAAEPPECQARQIYIVSIHHKETGDLSVIILRSVPQTTD